MALINYTYIIPEFDAEIKGFTYEIFKGIAKHRAAGGEKRRGSRATGTQTAQGHVAAQSGGMSAMHEEKVYRDGTMFSGGG